VPKGVRWYGFGGARGVGMLFSMGPDLQVLASHWMGLYCHIVRCNYINNIYFKCMNSRRGTHQRHYTALFNAISAGFQS